MSPDSQNNASPQIFNDSRAKVQKNNSAFISIAQCDDTNFSS